MWIPLSICFAALCVEASSLSARQTASSASTGDSVCVSSICVSATLNGTSSVDYVVSTSLSASDFGWVGIGFGSQMVQSPMIIMWPNQDGSMTLSQRIATQHTQPTVQTNPARVAVASPQLSTLTGNNLKFAFSVPIGSDTIQDHIYAISSSKPSSSAVNAQLSIHNAKGTFTLDYSKTNGGSSNPASAPSSSQDGYTDRQAKIIAHAVLASIGFLVVLPIGALIARLLRTFTPGPVWFNSHWVTQAIIGGLLIVPGVGLGINVAEGHLNDEHKKYGIALFVLYFAQMFFGAIIHQYKPKWMMPSWSPRRAVQNYFHATIGLLIIALGFKQVYSGFTDEWLLAGRGDSPRGVQIAFWVWLGVILAAYISGLALLKRQFRQEKEFAKKVEVRER